MCLILKHGEKFDFGVVDAMQEDPKEHGKKIGKSKNTCILQGQSVEPVWIA